MSSPIETGQLPASPVHAADPRPVPPEPPLPGDCCESGCDPCVYDSYSDALQYYRERLAAWQARHPEADADPGVSASEDATA